MKPKSEQGTLMREPSRALRQGDTVDPKAAGIKLIGPPRWRDGTAVTLVWVMVAETGRWNGHSAGPFEMTSKTFDQIVTNFEARGLPIQWDMEHASESESTSGTVPITGVPSQGWVHRLDNRGPAGLWALTEWLDTARDGIKAGRFAWCSPAVRFGCKDSVTGKDIGARLTSVAITGQPFLVGLEQLVAASDQSLATHAHMQPAEMESLAKCTLCSQKLMALMDDDDGGDVAMRVAAGALLLRDAEGKIVARDQTIALRDSEIATLKEEIEKRDDADRTARVSLAYATYKDTKKLGPADKEAMAYLCSSKRDVFERAFPIIEPEHAHLLRTVPPEARPRREGPMSFDEAAEGSKR